MPRAAHVQVEFDDFGGFSHFYIINDIWYTPNSTREILKIAN